VTVFLHHHPGLHDEGRRGSCPAGDTVEAAGIAAVGGNWCGCCELSDVATSLLRSSSGTLGATPAVSDGPRRSANAGKLGDGDGRWRPKIAAICCDLVRIRRVAQTWVPTSVTNLRKPS